MSIDPYVIGIIPARMASSRFPGKPLALIHNTPMVGHVFFRSKMSKSLKQVYVATCDHEISAYIESIGGKAIMTSASHERASDRTAECLLKVEARLDRIVDIVVMIQGDEPMVTPEMIDQAIKPLLQDASLYVVNLMARLKNRSEHNDPSEVKVVVDQNGCAMYFSREPIPSRKKGAKKVPMLKQVCIIPFRRKFLLEYNTLAPTPLEIVESVDMLRVLEYGYQVKMVLTDYNTYSVDTREDLIVVERKMAHDPLMKIYNRHYSEKPYNQAS